MRAATVVALILITLLPKRTGIEGSIVFSARKVSTWVIPPGPFRLQMFREGISSHIR